MSATYEQKIIYGFDKIHIAKMNDDGSFVAPVRILGGKKAEHKYESSSKNVYSDNRAVYTQTKIKSSTGKIGVLGLLTSEKSLLIGAENMSGGIAIKEGIKPPTVAVLYEQEKADGGKLLHVIYCAKFDIPAVNAVSTEEDIDENITDLEYVSIAHKSGYYGYTVDTTDPDVDNEMIENWYTTVQMPKPTSVMLKESKSKSK